MGALQVAATTISVALILFLFTRLRRAGTSLLVRLRSLDLASEFGGLTLAAADAVLKDDYKGPVREQLNNMNVILAQVERNSEDVVGRRAIMALHVGRNSGVGARGDNGTLPTAGSQQYEDIFIPIRYMFGRIELTLATIEAMGKDRGSFVRPLRSEMDGLTNDVKRDYSRQVWGTSDGLIADCGVTTASTTVVLDAATRQDQLRHLEEGFLIDIGDPATPTDIASGREVLSVDKTAKTIVISGAAVTTAATDIISRSGAYGASNNSGAPGDGQYELTGLQTIVDSTATLHTLAPSTEPRWAARETASVGALTQSRLMSEIMETEMASGSVIDLLAASKGVFLAYGNTMEALKRFTDTVQLKGGYEGVSVSSASMGRKSGVTTALVWDRDVPDESLYGLSLDDLVFFEQADWEWMDNDGAVLSRVANKASFEATLYKFGELAAKRRNSMFKLHGVSEA